MDDDEFGGCEDVPEKLVVTEFGDGCWAMFVSGDPEFGDGTIAHLTNNELRRLAKHLTKIVTPDLNRWGRDRQEYHD